MTIFFVSDFLKNLQSTLFRFPLASLSCAAFTVLFLNQLESNPWLIKESAAPTLVASFFWFIALQLFVESRQLENTRAKRIVWWCIGLVVAAGLFFYFDNYPIYTFFNFLFAFVAVAMVSPFLKGNFDHKALWLFLYRVGVGFLFSGIIILILSCGLSLIMLSLNYLFDARIDHGFMWLFIVSFGLVLPMLAMMQIPKDFSWNAEKDFGARLGILVEYVLSPLWITYALIINAYAARIAIANSLPRGKVSVLVLILGLSGFFIYFLGEGEGGKKGPNRIFRLAFGYLLIAPLILMGVGLYSRIEEYGLTEWRYANVLLLVVLSIGVICFLVRPREKLVRVFLCTFGLVSALSAIPQVSATELSVLSQHAKLKSILERNQVLVDNQIRKEHPMLSDADLEKAQSALEFLIGNRRQAMLHGWFPAQDAKQLVQVSDFASAMNIGLSYFGDEFDPMR